MYRHQSQNPLTPFGSTARREDEMPRLVTILCIAALLQSKAAQAPTIPGRDEGGLSLAAVNRMIAGAVRGLKAR